jgi:NAD(P)-dependent dehydrogenase (short-subunit alcohol dehydrogenase family)
MTMSRWLILGATSPIAREFARLAAAGGADIVLAGRDLEDMERSATDIRVRSDRAVSVVEFDALDMAAHEAFARRFDEAGEGPVGIFVAFGFMPAQAEIDAAPELGAHVIGANFTGAASVLLWLKPVLERRKGVVVVLGSVAGDRGRASNYTYGSAKAGLHTFLQGLRIVLGRAGVRVINIKPGFIDTGMSWGNVKDGPLMATPRALAERALKLADGRGEGESYFPWFWFIIMRIIKSVPYKIFRKLPI